MQPGESRQLQIVTLDCCYLYNVWPIPTVWSIEPDEGASLHPQSGLLMVDAETPHGATYTITANVENSRRLISRTLFVFSPKGNPLVGTWMRLPSWPASAAGRSLRLKRCGS